jgi:hypothetical protein
LYWFKLTQTGIIIRVKIPNSTVVDNSGATGLTSSTAGLNISTIADVEATATVYTSASSTIDTITTLGTFATPTSTHCRFKEVDATNHPGLYEIQLDNSRFAVTNAKRLQITIKAITASNSCQVDLDIPLTLLDPYVNSPNAGIPSLPATTVTTNASLLTSGASTDQLSVSAGKVLLQATQTGVTIPTVTTLTGGVIVTTNNDKTGYSLTQSFPANFANLSIDLSSGGVAVVTNLDKTGYTVSTNQDKTGYTLTSTYTPPAGFSSLAISAGAVTVGTNNDKNGYNLAGPVTVGTNNDKTGYTVSTVSDKTGYSLTYSSTVPSGVPTDLMGRINQIWWKLFGRSVKNKNSLEITMLDTSNTVLTTQAYTDDGVGNQTIHEAS